MQTEDLRKATSISTVMNLTQLAIDIADVALGNTDADMLIEENVNTIRSDSVLTPENTTDATHIRPSDNTGESMSSVATSYAVLSRQITTGNITKE